MRFKDKSIVITGGAGGMGRALARKFANNGAKVMISDLSEQGCLEIWNELSKLGTEIQTFPGNLAEKGYCENLIAHTAEKFGGVDILINNAGIIPRGPILDTTDEMWHSCFDVNLTAVFYLCRAAIPHMQKQGGGAIVNTSSMWGLYPGPNHIAYTTSKGALAIFTKCLARDYAPNQIRVNAVCPQEVNTPMLRTGFKIRGIDPETGIEKLNATVPLGRIAEPEDIADVIFFLASDDARYITGACVEVSGAKPNA
ncbi:SDR family NAD(P)-dependent oxidoreductase [Desulforhopalus singaporensis]|uniref:NAD(P)-dependent dehydrogenase, short-chain alcohol dehydrogenase family n=1 Tax=Desulforhopalus singaporensis TaxID=91360 RepID=A0A1H0VZF7_9BACT|nr:SDR family oxidoreductase [Desulforhopalus singaporensis]SDP83648.1 NAD(P)-dependent dehydrogenase, short-chain alcohol dehydrogenase family [Desulforhopalus singaporensis]